MDIAPQLYPLLFLVGLCAGLVDAVAGGGGVISLPVLLNLGLPVPLALGTNKLQSTFGAVMAVFRYARHGLLDRRACRVGVIATVAGALAGAATVRVADTGFLDSAIPWLLGAIVLYTLLRPKVGDGDHPPRMGVPAFFTVFGLGLGFYDGFFGPGTGSFWTIALVGLQGHNFLKATAYTKVMNATSNLASLVIFLSAGQVHLLAGLVMGAGQIVGARLGAGLAIKRGARFVRPVFVVMVLLVMVRLLYVRLAR
jgi:Predicted permeases